MNKNYLSLGIFAGLLLISLSMYLSVSSMIDSKRTVTVRGLCEQEVYANRVIWPIAFSESGNDIKQLASSVEKKNEIVINWLVSKGIPMEDITIKAPTVEDHTLYNNNPSNKYSMKSSMVVCSSNVEDVIKLQALQLDLFNEGIAMGGNSWEYPIVYEYTALNDIKPEMIEKATKNAREAANKFAKDSGSKVGRILSATQGQFSITNRDSNTPYIKNIRVVTTITYQLK